MTIENSADECPGAWVFDVDGCLIDSLTGSSLRPGAAELLSVLHRAGVRISVWSAGGEEHARARLEEQGISHLVHEFLSKSQRGPDGRYRWTGSASSGSTVFVDDHPEDLPVGVDVIRVAPYIAANPHDRAFGPAALRAEQDLGTTAAARPRSGC